jgi:LemA protein
LVVCVLIIALIGTYNGMVSSNTNVDGKWAQVENQLQRRMDLIPNLVETVKGYAGHENETIKAVADARSKLASAQTPAQKGEANGELSNALSRLLMIQENYPNLKADAHFKQLMDELSGTENRLAVARKDYNTAVQNYNVKIKSFPTVMFANMFGFMPREMFKADEAAKTAPKVNFNTK